MQWVTKAEDKASQFQEDRGGGTLPLKSVECANYGERDLFRVMRRAYDARSAIVHGGSPKDTRLPDDQSATLPTFIDAIEELVRLGLRKGLSMKEDGKKLRQAEYWEDLVFSKPHQ
jgi:hypothetical protein